MLLVHTIVVRPTFLAALIDASISASFSRLSEWLISVPIAPASLIVLAVICPVKLPAPTPSICCEYTGMSTPEATR